MQLSEMEYKGLNLLEEVCTVEIALDEGRNVIHIFDVNYVIEPVYDFASKKYVLNEAFYQFAEVLKSKYFFVEKRDMALGEWIASFTWQFYSSNQMIKSYREGVFSLVPKSVLSDETEDLLMLRGFYPKYVEKLR
jgi:hypothetical protein